MDFLENMTDDLRKRFERTGLIEKFERLTLGQVWDRYERYGEKRVKESTLRTYETTRKRFFSFFDPDDFADTVTQEDGMDWKRDLLERYAEASVAASIQRTKALFNWAVKAELIHANPFDGIPRGSMVNEKRKFFVTRDAYEKALEACPDQTWRTLLALCRIGGLRNPSETLLVKWEDVNWEKNRLLVHSPKTEQYSGKDSRVIPLFPELRVELEKQFEQAEEGGSPYVIDRWRDTASNMRTHLQRIIFRAGLDEWPKLFHNLRGSREIELNDQFPQHVAAAWIGHSEKIAIQHYLHPTDEHFERAAREGNAGGTSGDGQNPSPNHHHHKPSFDFI